MKNELVNPQEFGIEESKVNELLSNLPQIKEERSILEAQYNEIVKLPIDDLETTKQARELRLLIQKNRTQGINVWHKTTKDFFLKGGQFVDAIKRMEIAQNERMESTLQEIENYAEIQAEKKRTELKAKRLIELESYAEFVPMGIELGVLSDEEYLKVFNGSKLQFEAKVKAEKEEAERLEAERLAEIERQKAIEEENARLKLEAIEREKEIEAERKIQIEKEAKAKAENEILAKIEAEKQSEIEAKLKAETDARLKLEYELKAKQEAELKAEAERLANEAKAKQEAEKLAKAPIKKQLTNWVANFNIENAPIENSASKEIMAKFEAFKNWSIKEIEKL